MAFDASNVPQHFISTLLNAAFNMEANFVLIKRTL